MVAPTPNRAGVSGSERMPSDTRDHVATLAADWAGRRVLVTGGAGNLGSYLTEWLVAAGALVTVADDFSTGQAEHLAAVAGDLVLRRGDLAQPGWAEECCAGQEAVFHVAGVAPGLHPSGADHAGLLKANWELGSRVIGAARAAGVGRLLLVSSSCVYADDVPVPTPEVPLAGTEPEYLNSGYGTAKRRLEALAAEQAKAGMAVAIARPFNLYSPRDLRTGRGSHVLPSLLGRILDAEPALTIWGSGRQTRSLMHARDAAWVLAWLAAHHAVAEPVNVGSPDELSMRAMAEALFAATGVTKPLVCDLARPEGAKRKAADISRLRHLLGAIRRPETALADGLAEVVAAWPRAARRALAPAGV